MSLEALLATYGYPAIVVGTFLEGETILILAGFATHQGYLKLPWVIFCGFLGTLAGDQSFFYLGRARGLTFLEKRPYWLSRSRRVFDLMKRHPSLLVLGFRFLYGLRTVTPFLLGAGGLSPTRFLILNFLGALLWAVSVGCGGYLFGHVAEMLIGRLERYELYLFLGLALIGALLWSTHWVRRHKQRHAPGEPKM